MSDRSTLEKTAGAVAIPQGFFAQTFTSLFHRNYRYLWLGTVFMSGGQWIQQVTLGWLVYDLTGSAVLLGLLNGLRALPFLIASPIAGVFADRMDRRRLILVCEVFLAALTLLMAILVASGMVAIWHLFAFTVLTGIAWAFVDPIRQSLVPVLVPKADLMNAVALNSAAFNMTKVIGPSLGGLLIVAFGAAGNFLVQAVAYGAVLWFVVRMVVPPTPSEARRTSPMANLKEGLGYVWSNPVVFALMTAALVPRVFAMPFQVLMPVFQKDVLGVGPEGLGMLLAAPGLGALLAGLALATLSRRIERQGVFMLVSLVMLGFLMILFSWTRSLPLALVTLVFQGVFQIFYMATTHTMIQLIVPDRLRGRVMSIYALDRGLMPVGALFAGFAAHYVGAPLAVSAMGAIVIVLALLIAWLAPVVRELGVGAKS